MKCDRVVIVTGAGRGIGRAIAQRLAVAPHAIETEMSAQWPEEMRRRILGSIPLGRLGRPEEEAALVSFLALDEAGFITGATLDINGGAFMD